MMKITSRSVRVDEYYTETRYFAETYDGFDGTAQGYGYKSIEKLNKAYWYFKNKGRIKQLDNDASNFLKTNPDVKCVLKDYFSESNYVYALKDGEELSFDSLIKELRNDDNVDGSIIEKIIGAKPLWKSLLNKI